MSRRLDDRLEDLVRRLRIRHPPGPDEICDIAISMIPRARQLESRDEVRLSEMVPPLDVFEEVP